MKKIVVNVLSILIFTLFISSTQTSCKKDTVSNISTVDTVYRCAPSLTGLWIGSQQNVSGGQAFSCSIRTDGTFSYENTISGTRQLCTGTWSLTNSSFSANTTCIYGLPGNIGVTQSFTADYNSSTGILSNGVWNNTTPNNDSGTFTLTEVE